MIPLEEAQAAVLDGCPPLSPRRLPLAAAGGCVLAGDVISAEALPAFDNTAMDGYAVRASDVARAPVELPVVAEVAAGHPAIRALGPGEAMRIFTGAPIPTGADAVVMVERTEPLAGGARVRIDSRVPEGNHIRPAGDDVRPGDQVAAGGDQLTPARVGVLRSLGVDEVEVRPRPWVGVLSTGDELVDGGAPLQPGQIRDSNRPMLLALVAEAGFQAVDAGHAADGEEAIESAVEAASSRCDALLTSGGVSMGDTDLVKVVLDRMSTGTPSPMRWMQVAIKPAKPLAFGTVPGRGRPLPVFGLPGNPVSALVSFELFARPGLRRLAGHRPDRWHRPALRGRAEGPIDRPADGKTHLLRVQATVEAGEVRVRRLDRQGSHQLGGMAQANALAVLPDGNGVGDGEAVDVLVLDW